MPTVSGVGRSPDLHTGEPSSGTQTQEPTAPAARRSVAASSPLLVNLAPRERGGGQALAPHGRQLAGYLRGRVAMNKAIDGEEVEDLKDNQISLARTRAALKPANVLDAGMQLDVGAYARDNTATELARQLCGTLQQAASDPTKPLDLKDMIPFDEIKALGGENGERYFLMGERMMMAACGLYARVAVCDKFARAAVAVHAPRMRENQTAAVMGSDQPFPHSWMHVQNPGADRQDIVQDGWAKGPVVLAEDSRRAADHQQASMPSMQTGPALSQAEARIFAQGVAKVLGKLQSNPRIAFNLQMRSAQKKDAFDAFIAHPDGGVGKLLGISHAMPVLSDEFIAHVQAALQEESRSGTPHSALLNDIRSAGVGRAMGLNVKSATDQQNIADIEAAARETVGVVADKAN